MAVRAVAAAMILAVAGVGVPARASDTAPCPAGLICATDPQGVAKIMTDEGFRAKIDVDKGGDPLISSAAAGYDFDVFFYGCTDHKACDSLQFRATFERGASSDVVLMNRWNAETRFGQMSVNDKGIISLSYDVSTIGGLNKRNFADVLSWWSTILGQAGKFFSANAAAAPAAAVRPAS